VFFVAIQVISPRKPTFLGQQAQEVLGFILTQARPVDGEDETLAPQLAQDRQRTFRRDVDLTALAGVTNLFEERQSVMTERLPGARLPLNPA
jgi:hypothetical protein